MAFAPRNEAGEIDDGGSMVWDEGDYLYVLKGGDGPSGNVMAENFWRYSISNNSWEILTDAPQGVGDKNGPRLAFAGGKVHFWHGFGSTGFWRYEPPEFFASGNFTSSVFDAGSDSVWQQITWDASLPQGAAEKKAIIQKPYSTSIRIWTRSSSDNSTWTEWVRCTNGSRLPWEDRYLQYRVEFSTTSGVATPTLREVCITYVPKTPRVGAFVSHVLELGPVESWGEFSWEATLHENTSISFATRSSPDGSSWSDWEELESGFVRSPPHPYLQVRAEFRGLGTTTPVFQSYSISYTPNRTRTVPAEFLVMAATCAIAAGAVWGLRAKRKMPRIKPKQMGYPKTQFCEITRKLNLRDNNHRYL